MTTTLIIIILAGAALILAYLLYKERIRNQKIIEFHSDNESWQDMEKELADLKAQMKQTIKL